MIQFPIVDTHVHLWDPDNLSYPWLADVPLLNKSYLLDDYRVACGSIEIGKMVFVQCECDFGQFAEEAEWVAGLVSEEPRIEGIVPWAPLEKGDAARQDLELLTTNPLIKGIRRIIQFEDDMAFCLRPDFVRGIQLLEDFDLHFEICITHLHMANTIKMVRECPNIRFILDHIGKPDIKNHVFEPWKTELKTLAEMANVWCKMSGLVVEADMDNWTRDDLKPYIDHVLECFDFDRTMFGGDWPVVLQAAELPRWVETLEWAVQGCSQDELERLFRRNAIEFYRLREL
ncbi:MAG TPA: amidohydrolase family protein [Candidatus Hydrogenedentes bacterium]|nr:amidohydrolase family protein [Candidatus Hydrogenedentota bacterium]HIJ75059.1 amidohydrolase family protein [Candidatus Hydrogenedentota bacterium]